MDGIERTYITKDGSMYISTEFGIFQLIAGDELTPEEFDKIEDKELLFESNPMSKYAGLIATKSEKRCIAELLADDVGGFIEAMDELEGRDIIVKRDYISDGPGFCGDLFIIIWGEPQFISYIGYSDKHGWKKIFSGEL